MVWTERHDVLLCREALLVEPYAHKQGSRERGNAWDMISSELNSITEIQFNVTKRSVRDRYNLLIENFKKTERENEKASGINIEETELDNLLRELVEKAKEAALGYADRNKSVETEKQCAEEIRLQAMESLGETKKRKEHSPDDETPKKFRRTNTDTLSYLRERSESLTVGSINYGNRKCISRLRKTEFFVNFSLQTTKIMIIMYKFNCNNNKNSNKLS